MAKFLSRARMVTNKNINNVIKNKLNWSGG